MSTSHVSGPLISDAGFEGAGAVSYFDDFLGAGKVVIPAVGSAESGMAWVKKIVGAAPPTVAGVADAVGGVVGCTLTADSQKQDAALYHGDQRNFDISKAGILEFKIKVPVLPSAAEVKLVAGLFGDWVDNPESIAQILGISMIGSGLVYCDCDDNTTDNHVSSGITLVANDVLAVRIDYTNVANILFYMYKNPTSSRIDWQRVARGTTFAFAATGANAVLQPYISAYKASGTGIGTIQTDYVSIRHSRY